MQGHSFVLLLRQSKMILVQMQDGSTSHKNH